METTSQLFECRFCTRRFNRPDALKRHWKTCAVRLRAGMEVPEMAHRPRGKKPRACDRCARLRRACTGFEPCRTCSKFQLLCTYNRIRQRAGKTNAEEPQQSICTSFESENNGLESISSDASLSSDPFLHIAGQDQVAISGPIVPFPEDNRTECVPTETAWSFGDDAVLVDDLFQRVPNCLLFPRPTDMDLEALKTFPFFRRMASFDGLGNIFECGNVSERTVIACELDAPISQPLLTGDITPHRTNLESGSTVSNDTVPGCEGSAFASLSESIITSLTQGVICDQTACKRHSSNKETLVAACRALFSSHRLPRYLSLYWACWHPNWPVVHKASFSIVKAPPTLLAAMAVIGACLSTIEEDRALAKVVFDDLEDAVFCHDIFSEYQHADTEKTPATLDLRKQLEILIAAYCVCLYQTWEGGKTAKRRVRRQRFNQIICLARDITAHSASLKNLNTEYFAAFDWHEFAIRESLVRTFAYINNLDTGLSIFYQEPMRMLVSELTFDLSTPEACFAAQTAEDCFAALKVWRATFWPQKSISVTSAVSMLCSESCSTATDHLISRLGVLSMFTLISTLYKIAHQLENSLVCSTISPALRDGLNNWRRLWPSEHRDSELLDVTAAPQGLWFQRIGFQRHAPEYWLYTRMALERAQRRSVWNDMLRDETVGYDDTDKVRFNALLHEFGNMQLVAI